MDADYLDRLARKHRHGGLTPQGLRFVLAHAARALERDPAAPWLEVGTHIGATTLALLELAETHADPPPLVVTVDPYGDKPYRGGDVVHTEPLYGDQHYVAQKLNLARTPHHAHFLLRGVDFLLRVQGAPYWREGRAGSYTGWGFCFLDGEHDRETVLRELELLQLQPGGRVVVDNTDKDPGLPAALEGMGFQRGPPMPPGAGQAVWVRP